MGHTITLLQSQVPIDNGPVRKRQDGHFEAKLPDRRRHLIHDGVVLSRITRVRHEVLYRTLNNLSHLPPLVHFGNARAWPRARSRA